MHAKANCWNLSGQLVVSMGFDYYLIENVDRNRSSTNPAPPVLFSHLPLPEGMGPQMGGAIRTCARLVEKDGPKIEGHSCKTE